jgi:IS30 family transposase
MRRVKHASTAGQRRGQILDGLSIRDRPADVEDPAIPGHLEGDLITGSQNTHMATLVEGQSRFTLLVKVQEKDTTSVVTALSTQIRQLPAGIAPVINLGSRNGIGPAQTFDGQYHGAGLLL